jgi:acyl-CoA synthetase (AMP-forming)/AMP-acid ligase II
LIELLRAAAARTPGQPAVITNDRTTTYAELLAMAEASAAALADRGIARFGIVDQDASVVLALLAGSSLVGAEACVYSPIETGEEAAELARRFDHLHVVCADPGLAGEFEIVDPRTLVSGAAGDGTPLEPPEQRPLLILTTGTTGVPRGVRHDFSRVLRSAQHIHPTPEQRWLLAFGLHQFAGLQILVHVLASNATLIAPAPRRPREGLAAMREHGVTHASATPTFWRFLLAEMRSDGGPVPALTQITLGGEAVPEALLGELRETFPDAHVSQIYSANESGSSRSVRDGHAGLPASVLEPDESANIEYNVIDGQLWVRSHIGMLGYYGEEPIDPDAWRATGDLVEIEGDRIVFRGRASDIINVGGVKVHPLPIEQRIGGLPGVEIARVFGRPNALTGAIVAVEVVAEADADRDRLADEIREACEDLPAAARPRSVRFVDTVPITHNKISRTAQDDS